MSELARPVGGDSSATWPVGEPDATGGLLGRGVEKAALDRVVAAARAGVGGSLVLRGEPGIGRTSLLEYAVGRAHGMSVFRLAGLDTEMGLGFAGLYRLLIPMASRFDRLPGPQRDAVRAVFGLIPAAAPDRFLVGLAALAVLADLAVDQPLLVAVDDAQWLDRATIDVLGFVARRLTTERIGLVITVREPAHRCRPLDGLPALHHGSSPRERRRVHEALAAVTDAGTDPDGRALHVAAAAAGPDEEVAGEPVRSATPARDDADHAADAVLTLAGRGQQATTRPAVADGISRSIEAGAGLAVQAERYALTVLELGLGRYEAALAAALTVYRDDPPAVGTRILPDLVEAAVRCGNHSAARAAVDRLAERTHAGGTPLAAGLLARSRALLAGSADAEALYQQAIDQLRQSTGTAQLARTHLLYGEWLRRQRRRRDARHQLCTARDMFDALGLEAFAQRSRGEVLATGERASKRNGDATEQLTPQETQVARLVVEGSSNRQVAAQLFISPNTVEYHLQKVFRKVGVSSRTQLARSLFDQTAGDGAALAATLGLPSWRTTSSAATAGAASSVRCGLCGSAPTAGGSSPIRRTTLDSSHNPAGIYSPAKHIA